VSSLKYLKCSIDTKYEICDKNSENSKNFYGDKCLKSDLKSDLRCDNGCGLGYGLGCCCEGRKEGVDVDRLRLRRGLQRGSRQDKCNNAKAGKLSFLYNYNCNFNECFEHTFGSVGAGMTELEPFEILIKYKYNMLGRGDVRVLRRLLGYHLSTSIRGLRGVRGPHLKIHLYRHFALQNSYEFCICIVEYSAIQEYLGHTLGPYNLYDLLKLKLKSSLSYGDKRVLNCDHGYVLFNYYFKHANANADANVNAVVHKCAVECVFGYNLNLRGLRGLRGDLRGLLLLDLLSWPIDRLLYLQNSYNLNNNSIKVHLHEHFRLSISLFSHLSHVKVQIYKHAFCNDLNVNVEIERIFSISSNIFPYTTMK
jgi:hypothetical protein